MRYAHKSVSDKEVRELFTQQHKEQSDDFAKFKFTPVKTEAEAVYSSDDEEAMYHWMDDI